MIVVSRYLIVHRTQTCCFLCKGAFTFAFQTWLKTHYLKQVTIFHLYGGMSHIQVQSTFILLKFGSQAFLLLQCICLSQVLKDR